MFRESYRFTNRWIGAHKMANSLLIDNSIRAAQKALNGLALREEAISRNVANVDTPGYQAIQVDFESALQNQMKGGGSLGLAVTSALHMPSSDSLAGAVSTTLRPGGSARADGNNVDIDVEMAQMTETGIRYEALLQLVSNKLTLLKSIASGR
jgi:flagellar basal-body rod protein FlgB